MTNHTIQAFPVYYPLGGRTLLLEWWDHNEGHHVILARSEDLIQQIANRVFKKHPHSEITSYLEIDVVAPSKLLCSLVPKFDYQENVRVLQDEITVRLKEVLEVGSPAPPQFKECQKYESKFEDENIDKVSLEFGHKSHYDCKNCHDGIIFTLTPEELYEKYWESWGKSGLSFRRNTSFKSKVIREKRVPSCAEQARDDEHLWCAVASFGHHSRGVELVVVDQSIPEDFNLRPVYLSDRALFFYRKLSELDPTKIGADLLASKRNSALERERESKAWQAQRAREEKECIDTFLSFFHEP